MFHNYNFDFFFFIADTSKKPLRSFPKPTNVIFKLTIQNKEETMNVGLQVFMKLPAFMISLLELQTVVLAFAFLAKSQKRRWDIWKTGDHLPTVTLMLWQM